MSLLLLDSEGSAPEDAQTLTVTTSVDDTVYGGPHVSIGPVRYSFADGYSHIESITNSEATISLSSQTLYTVETIVRDSDDRSVSEEGSGSLTVIQRTWGSTGSLLEEATSSGGASNFSVNLQIDVQQTAGVESLVLRPQLTMGAAYSPTRAFHHARIEMRLPPIGNASDCRVLFPSSSVGEVYGWEQVQADTLIKTSLPGINYSGGEQPATPSNPTGDSGTNQASEPSGELVPNNSGFWPLIAVWNHTTGVGCLFRTTDILGRGHLLTLQRDSGTNEMTIGCRFIPKDNSIGINGNSDDDFTDYGLEVRPFLSPDPTSAWYDAIVYSRERAKVESHQIFSKGRIHDRPSVGANAYPDRVRNATVFGSVTVDDTNPSFTRDLWVDNFTSIAENIGVTEDKVISLIYGAYQGTIGEHQPSNPYRSDALQPLADLYNDNFTTLLYTIPIHPGVWDGTYGLPPGQALNDDLSKDDRGNLIIGETPIVPGDSGGLIYIQPSFLDDAATSDYYDYIVSELQDDDNGGTVQFRGIYDDAGNAFWPPANDDPLISADDRGIGSRTWWSKNRNRFEICKTRMEAAGISDPIIMAEWPSSMSVGAIDLFFDQTVTAADQATLFMSRRVFAGSILYSEYSRIANIDNFGDGPTDFYDVFAIPPFSRAEVFNNLYAIRFHAGQILSFAKFFENNLDYWFQPSDMDDEYVSWTRFVRNMYVKADEAVRHYHVGRRLRELATSYVRRQVENQVTGDDTFLGLPEHKAQTSVWYNPDTDVVAVFATNSSSNSSSSTPVQYSFTDTITEAGWPELGSSNRDVRKWNISTGAVSSLAGYTGTSYTFSDTLNAEDVILYEFSPEGSGAGLITAEKNLLPRGVDEFSSGTTTAELNLGPTGADEETAFGTPFAYILALFPTGQDIPSEYGVPQVSLAGLQQSLVVWADNLSGNLDYYEVTKNGDSSIVYQVQSAYFLDPEFYGNSDLAEATTYSVSVVVDGTVTLILDEISVWTADEGSWSIDDGYVCMLSGTAADLGLPGGERADVRMELIDTDGLPSSVLAFFEAIDTTAWTNAGGSFTVPAPRGSMIRLRCPEAGYHYHVITPDAEDAELADLEAYAFDPTTSY